MTKSEFIQQACLGAFKQGFKDPWGEAQSLANAAPAGMFDQAQQSPPKASGGGAAGGMTFPNFGATKNAPVAGAAERDLRYYAHAAVRTLSDSAQSKWHGKERARLDAYIAELERQGKDASEFKQAPKQDDGRRAPPMQTTDPLDGDGSDIAF